MPLVYNSVVGADRIPIGSRVDRAMFGYFGSKLAAERIVADSGLPFTTLQALLDAGAQAQQEIKDVGGGKLIASVKDADGNVIGLIQSA